MFHLWGWNDIHFLSLLSKIFSCQHRTTRVFCQIFWHFGVHLDILCINLVFNAFMCTIEIWTTCTCSSAYKLVEKSNLCPLGACLGPMQEMAMNFKHEGTIDCRQNVEILCFYILVNLKLVWNSWNLACYHGAASTWHGKIFVPFGAGFGICFSQTGASHNKHDGFR